MQFPVNPRTGVWLFGLILMTYTGTMWADWANWRGKYQNGYSEETNLVDQWSTEGENLIWRQDFIGRSTPVVLNGRVYVIGRTGEGVAMQERVACFDAESGALVWDYRYNIRNSYVPFTRIGWASMVGDPETGYVYSMGSGGVLHCFDKDGHIVWKRLLIEEFAIRTGYGGRVTNPVIDEDRVIVGFVSAGWGDQKPMKHRHFAFHKRTGEVIWMATPGQIFKSPNIYSNPVIAVIDGIRLFIAGNSDGYIYAMKSRTGEKVWEFQLSKGGINSSVVVDGYRVYAAHSEENVDVAKMGRVVCFDGRGRGNITQSNEIWRFDAEVGYTSPLLANGRIYFVDNHANLYALDAQTGQQYWEFSLGTVGKGSPVWGDGKIYVPETNGRFWILRPGENQCELLDQEDIRMPAGRAAEIFGSPAIAYGRIYFATENGLFCLGDPSATFRVSAAEALVLPPEAAPEPDAQATHLQVVPAEIVARGGKSYSFTARAFDEKGRFLKELKPVWNAPENLGKIYDSGQFVATTAHNAAGIISAQLGELKGTARVRVFTDLPWIEDFENYEENENPPYWLGAGSAASPGGRYIVATLDGNKVLKKPPASRGIQRHIVYFGPSDMKDYVIQADVRTDLEKRRLGDAGLIANGYELDLMGKRKRLELRSWTSENRIKVEKDFVFEPDTWYTMKLTIDYHADKALVKGKVWKTADPEPAEWTITVEDPYPTWQGSPGLQGVSYVNVYFDNVKVLKK